MADKLIQKGGRGEEVSGLQQKLNQLGYSVKTDGIFGDDTDKAVRELQTMFGYDVDGIVGPGTSKLIDAQIGYGWNKNAPDAFQKAQKAQGKGDAGGKMAQGGGDKFGKQPQAQQGQQGGMPPEKTMGASPGQPQSTKGGMQGGKPPANK